MEMADPQSIQMLAFNFTSRTYAFKRLAQGLTRAVSAFSSFMRQQLDKCMLNDKCFQYVDDGGTAAIDAKEMIANLKEIFECIRKSGFNHRNVNSVRVLLLFSEAKSHLSQWHQLLKKERSFFFP